jgi:Glutamine amidotransferase class-I
VIEGIRSARLRAFGVQYHPEAGPGPHDAAYLFGEFAALMDASRGDGFRRPKREVMSSVGGTHDLGLATPEPIASGALGHRGG